MAQLDPAQVTADQLMTIDDFRNQVLGEHMTAEGIAYNFGIKPTNPDRIDFVWVGGIRLIVKTEKTLSFKPRKSRTSRSSELST